MNRALAPRAFWRTAPGLLALGCLVAAGLMGCAAPSGAQTLQPFTTDGCSRFPDRAPHGSSDWCHCCVVHDLAYWRGGTAQERLDADRALRSCVARASGSAALAELMFAGVRAGGGPQFATSYRWGYGWPMGRPYQALTADEQARAAKLEQAYRARDPLLSCPPAVPPGR